VSRPSTIVIFGASGDLTRRKLVPALYNLERKGRLPTGTRIVGSARRPYSHEDFRREMESALREFAPGDYDAAGWSNFAGRLSYVPGDANESPAFNRLADFLQESGDTDRLYYLATVPEFYPPIVENLGASGLSREDGGARRIVVEKPFGRDLDSARALDQKLHAVFEERQIFRIDHYLGKETAQNILFFRFGNIVFEPIWNRNYVDHVQITVAETVDVGHRAGFYDTTGVLRDMFQNHLLQLLALVAMEPPASFQADALRDERAKVLSAVRPLAGEAIQRSTVRGQYRGYRGTEGVAPDSQTATYAAMCLRVDNWRWQGVPFYLRSGKAMAEKTTEIIIQFRCPPHVMFPQPARQKIKPNLLALFIQPHEGIHQRFEAKVPDTVAETRSVDMEFRYAEDFGDRSIPDAYERLLLDALSGDASLFTRSDSIGLSWKIVDPIIKEWEESGRVPLATYEPGSWGPAEADDLLARDGRGWMRGYGDHHPAVTG
jgi:glucose-6-phosphate 1-dehydrogenase